MRTAIVVFAAAAALLCLFSCKNKKGLPKRSHVEYDNYVLEAAGDSCVIMGYLGTESRVIIPDTVNGLRVTAIGENAFNGCVALREIVLPESVTDVSRAFVGCPDLRAAYLGGGVTDMEGAFRGCGALTHVEGFERAERMPEAFYGCGALKSCFIPSTATDCRDAFRGCVTLTDVTICDGAAGLDGTFTDCIALESISLPESVTELRDTFRGCSSLTEIKGIENVTALYGCFAGCTSLTEITLGRFVTEMHGVFTDCIRLTRVGNMPASLETYSASFGGCPALTFIRIPVINSAESEANYRAADDFRGCSGLKNVIIDCDVTAFDTFCDVFGDCSSLEAMTVTEKTLKEFAEVGYVFTDRIYDGDDNRIKNAVLSYSHDAGARTVADFSVIGGVSYARISGGDIGYFDADAEAAGYGPVGFVGYTRSMIWLGFPMGKDTGDTVAVVREYEFCLIPSGNNVSLPESFYIHGSVCHPAD